VGVSVTCRRGIKRITVNRKNNKWMALHRCTSNRWHYHQLCTHVADLFLNNVSSACGIMTAVIGS